MIIVIDGYNLLHYLFRDSQKTFDQKRELLISTLQNYAATKAADLFLVLDGGPTSSSLKERSGKITLVYSGRFQSADEWIIDFMHKHRAHALVLVTRDRALIKQCPSSVEVLDPALFSQVLDEQADNRVVSTSHRNDSLKKYHHDDEEHFYSREELDTLMEMLNDDESSLEKEEHTASRTKSGQKKSKKERRLQRVIKKL